MPDGSMPDGSMPGVVDVGLGINGCQEKEESGEGRAVWVIAPQSCTAWKAQESANRW